MNCTESTGLFSEHFDGGLSTAERLALERHLAECGSCATDFEHFTRSLKALHDTAQVETTGIFLSRARAAAEEQVKTGEIPVADRPSGGRPPTTPPWLPYALAAVLIVAFAMGWIISGGGRDRKIDELERKVEKLADQPPLPPDPIVVEVERNPEKVLAGRGLVKVGDEWMSRERRDALEAGKVGIGLDLVDRSEAARLLAKEFPPEKPPAPPVAPKARSAEEILEDRGYVKLEGEYFSPQVVKRFGQNEVMVAPGVWEKPSELDEAFMKEHGLVRVEGKVMTAEQAAAIRAQQLVLRPDVATAAANDVTRALDGLRIGPPMNYRGVTVYPLIAAGDAKEAAFETLHASLGREKKVILADKARLFSVDVRNGLEKDVLFLSGEILTGGRCTRVVARDTVAAGGASTAIPVFCVEPSRWKGDDKFADSSGHYIAPPSIRRALVRDEGQGTVWSLLAERLEGKGGQVDLFRRRAAAILDYKGYFTVLPERAAGAVGVAVAIGDSLEFVEIFQNHDLLEAYFDRLVAGAALEVLERAGKAAASRSAPAVPNSVKGVKEFLESAFFWTYEAQDDGFDVRREKERVGRARIAGGSLNHALLFAPSPSAGAISTEYSVPRDKMTKALSDYEARLKRQDPPGRIGTLRELASIHSPEVTKLLLRRLSDAHVTVRRAAIAALGKTGGRGVAETLMSLLAKSRKDPETYGEIVGALARLGDGRAVTPLLREAERGNPELAKLAVLGLPELLLQVRTRDPLERAMRRLVDFCETSEAAARQEGVVDPKAKAQAVAFHQAVRTVLSRVSGEDHPTGAAWRAWWNDRKSRERFLRERRM